MKSRMYLYPALALAALFQGCSVSDKPSPAQPETKTAAATQTPRTEKAPAELADSPLLPQVAEIVEKTIARPQKPIKIHGRSTWKELGADSLDIAEITMNCEDAFKIEISDKDLEKIATVGDLARLVEMRQKSPPAAKIDGKSR